MHNKYTVFRITVLCKGWEQGFSTWPTCTPRGTFAYLKANLRLAVGEKNIFRYYFCSNIYTYNFETTNEKFFGFFYFTQPFCHKKF